MSPPAVVYERRRPEETTLYDVVRENLETLYAAVEEGAVANALPKFVKKELEGYLDCGLLCRGFARVQCGDCAETRLVAFSCKGRGFCPSCLGRRMCETAANLVECVLPEAALRQWVLTFPFGWRKRLAYDGKLLGALTRIFVGSVLRFYTERMAREGAAEGQSGAIVVVQRTSSDMKCNPHLHVVFLDGVFREGGGGGAGGAGDEVRFRELPRLSSTEVGEVLADATKRMAKHLRRKGLLLGAGEPEEEPESELAALTASAVSGVSPPAGPEFRRGARALALPHIALTFDKPLCAALDGFTLHAATRAGALDRDGREALLKYVLRPSVAQERVTHAPGGLVRIALKRPFSDGTVAVDMDPLSLLCRLAASVPAPRFHTVRYAGVLAPASKLRPRIVPSPSPQEEQGHADHASDDDKPVRKGCRYRPWAELLKRTFQVDVLCCPKCHGRMKLVAMVTDAKSVTRFLHALGERTEPPERVPARGPPYWRSTVLRRASLPGAA